MTLGDAIQSLLRAFRADASVHPNPDGHGQFVIHPSDHEVTGLDGLHRCQRVHRMDDVNSFAAWLLRHADPKIAEIFVDADHIIAGLDPKDDAHDKVRCDLVLHPRAARWRAILGKRLDQKTLHRHLIATADDFEDWKVADDNLGSYGRILAGEVAKLEIARRGDYTAHLDPRGFYTFQGGNEHTDVAGRIPASFKFEIPWFRGVCLPTEEACTYSVEVLLDMDVDNPASPGFVLAAPDLPLVEYQAREDAVAWLRHLLPDEFLVGLGSYGINRVEARSDQS